MRSFFVYAGKNSLELGVCIEKCPSFAAAPRNVEKLQVPGRNGALVLDTGTYANTTQSYEIWFKNPNKNATQAARDVAFWLLSSRGYMRLEDSYDPDIYRMAVFSGPLDVQNWMLMRGRTILEFECKPQRYLKSGEHAVKITQGGQKLQNQWMPALPLIRLNGSGTGRLLVGDSTIDIMGMTGGVTIDSTTQNAYNGTVNLNNSIKVTGGFPVLSHGETAVAFSGGITSAEIIPRWWTL